LYGCMLDWNEIGCAEHRAMLEDVARMIAIRKREAAILPVAVDQEEPRLRAVPCKCSIDVPVPYVRWSAQGAILVAANRDTSRDAQVELRVPLEEMGLGGHESHKVSDPWFGGKA